MGNYDEFKKTVTDRDASDIWLKAKVSDIKVTDLKNGCISCNRLISQDFPENLQGDDEALMTYAINGKIGCYLTIDGKDYAFDDNALNGFAGLVQAGGFITLLTPKGEQEPVTEEVRAMVLNLASRCFEGNGENGKETQMLFRDDHICTSLSESYTVFPFGKFLSLAEETLPSLGETNFVSGDISEDYDEAIFQIDSPDLEKKVSGALEVPNAKLFVKICSGDTGQCSVSVYPMVSASGDVTLFGEPMKIKHDSSKCNAENVTKNLAGAFSSVQETAELIAGLKNIPVKHIGGMFKRLAKAVGLPKKESLQMAEYLEGCPEKTQFRVWWAILQVLNVWERSTKPSKQALLNKQEAVFRLVTKSKGKFDAEDAPFDWEATKIQ